MNNKFKNIIICLGCGSVFDSKGFEGYALQVYSPSQLECPECFYEELVSIKDLMECEMEWDNVRMDLFLTSLMKVLNEK